MAGLVAMIGGQIPLEYSLRRPPFNIFGGCISTHTSVTHEDFGHELEMRQDLYPANVRPSRIGGGASGSTALRCMIVALSSAESITV